MTPERKQALDEFIEFFKQGPQKNEDQLKIDKEVLDYALGELKKVCGFPDREAQSLVVTACLFWNYSRQFKK